MRKYILYLSEELDQDTKTFLKLQENVDKFNRHVQHRYKVSYIRNLAKNKELLQVPEGFSMHFHHAVGYYDQQIKKRYQLEDVRAEGCPQTMEIRRVK